MATRRRTGSSTTRRKLVWARHSTTGATVSTVLPIKVNLLDQFETRYGANLLGATVTRIRGLIVCGNNISPSATGQLKFAARIGAASEVGGDLNDPVTQPYLDWMLWEPFSYLSLPDTPQTVDSMALSRVIDVKSQRRLEELDQELQMWVAASSTTFAFSWDLSILLKLP